jgi:hypothetical protein
MFDDEAMVKLARHLPIGDNVEAARADFISVGERIRAIIDTVPSSFDYGPDDMSLSKRARWLQQNVLNPIQTLREAMADAPMFEHYPERNPPELLAEQRRSYIGHLAALEHYTIELRDDLATRARPRNLSHNNEMRHEFLYWIAQAVRCHAGDLEATRSYTGIDNGAGKGNASPFFAAVKIAYVEITRETEPQLEDYFKDLVKLRV